MSDCNPASAGGILGALIGYDVILRYWAQDLRPVEARDFAYTDVSLQDVCDMSFRHALQMIVRNGGRIDGDRILINRHSSKPVRLEIGFEGH